MFTKYSGNLMKILKTNQNKVDKKVIDEAVKVLADGGVILYPTDTGKMFVAWETATNELRLFSASLFFMLYSPLIIFNISIIE